MAEPRTKLIEVALPLVAINRAAAREKSLRHGHPSTLHLWWSRKPLAICRAVLLASLLDDPSARPDLYPTPADQARERSRLLKLVEDLVAREPATSARALRDARAAIAQATGGAPPRLLDPFCGGGSVALEGQRLGLQVTASDLNPVAVLITVALLDLPARYAACPPVRPDQAPARSWEGAAGLAADVRYYGRWMRAEAIRRIGDLYPDAPTSGEAAGPAAPIAWIWARTVRCANPACGLVVPLVRKWWLALHRRARTWVEPLVDRAAGTIHFGVRSGAGKPPPATVDRQGATCLVCHAVLSFAYVRAEARAGRLGQRLLAVVAAAKRSRRYLSPTAEQEDAAGRARPHWAPRVPLPRNRRNFNTPLYGLDTFDKLFTPRQLTALATFADLVDEARARVLADARAARWCRRASSSPADAGDAAEAYAAAVATYLAFAVDRCADAWSSLAGWRHTVEATRGTFARQALPMTWDYAEANPFGPACGNWLDAGVGWIAEVLEALPAAAPARVEQRDAATTAHPAGVLISTDPPYYDNVDHGGLSDYFYVWLRRSLGRIYPVLCSTVLTPKAGELVALPYRFAGGRAEAHAAFERGLRAAFERLRSAQHPEYPLTVYYAYRQVSRPSGAIGAKRNGHGSRAHTAGGAPAPGTGWEALLESLVRAGFAVTGTWPVRSERGARSVALGTNALTSSIVVVCRPRLADGPTATRRQFLADLRAALPPAVAALQAAGLAAVDLAQAAIGPGIAVYTRYAAVVAADGRSLSVGEALQLINQELAQVLDHGDNELDGASRFCVAWFEAHGRDAGPYGEADLLARAKNTVLARLEAEQLVICRAGSVHLCQLAAEPTSPATEWTAWAVTERLANRLAAGGTAPAAGLLAQLGSAQRATARALAYRLYAICEQQGRAAEARHYSALVAAWPELEAEAGRASRRGPRVAATSVPPRAARRPRRDPAAPPSAPAPRPAAPR
jgi:putative DNA methylase